MEAVEFQGLIDQISGLTAEQRTALIEAVRAKASVSEAVSLIDRRFAAAPRCPHCQSVAVGTWSRPKPLTRYKCRDCRRTFTGLTGTPLERLRRRDPWLDYAQSLADGVSLRKAAKRCGIVLDTALRWPRPPLADRRGCMTRYEMAEQSLPDIPLLCLALWTLCVSHPSLPIPW
jgi:transposase-like protein